MRVEDIVKQIHDFGTIKTRAEGKFDRSKWVILLGKREKAVLNTVGTEYDIAILENKIVGIDFYILSTDTCFSIIEKQAYDTICLSMKREMIFGLDRMYTTTERRV